MHNLHYEMKKIRKIPKQTKTVSEYMLYLAEFAESLSDREKNIYWKKENSYEIKN